MKYCVVIPVRINSTRLPRKPLLDIVGKSMICRTFEQVNKCVPKELIFIATDNEEIMTHCLEFTTNVFMTDKECETGTDRVAEFAKSNCEYDYYLNVQGDEPLIDPEDINRIFKAQMDFPNEVINGFAKIQLESEFRSLSVPKMVISEKGYLLYSSRNPIPGNKSDSFIKGSANKQICIYSFPKNSLRIFGSHKVKTHNESIEDIEIIRFLDNDIRVKMIECHGKSIAVDTPHDLEKVKQMIFRNTSLEN